MKTIPICIESGEDVMNSHGEKVKPDVPCWQELRKTSVFILVFLAVNGIKSAGPPGPWLAALPYHLLSMVSSWWFLSFESRTFSVV